MKVVVTGSRDWPWSEVIWDDLSTLAWQARHAGEEFHVFYGDADGADDMAESWVENNGSFVTSFRRFFADWGTHGKAAGPIRNKQMVDHAESLDAGKFICLAYSLNSSRGTANCAVHAYRAGAEVRMLEVSSSVWKGADDEQEQGEGDSG